MEDTREQKYFIVHQYLTIKDGIRNSCDTHRDHVLPKLCGAGGHQTAINILSVDYNVTCSISLLGSWYDDIMSVQLT